jgi:hypothetical protein
MSGSAFQYDPETKTFVYRELSHNNPPCDPVDYWVEYMATKNFKPMKDSPLEKYLIERGVYAREG